MLWCPKSTAMFMNVWVFFFHSRLNKINTHTTRIIWNEIVLKVHEANPKCNKVQRSRKITSPLNVMLKLVGNTWYDLELHYAYGSKTLSIGAHCNTTCSNILDLCIFFKFCRYLAQKIYQRHDVLDDLWHKQTRSSL